MRKRQPTALPGTSEGVDAMIAALMQGDPWQDPEFMDAIDADNERMLREPEPYQPKKKARKP